jgi:hypothetical protein
MVYLLHLVLELYPLYQMASLPRKDLNKIDNMKRKRSLHTEAATMRIIPKSPNAHIKIIHLESSL